MVRVIICLSIALTIWAALDQTALARTYAVYVRDVQCYRHAVETDDRLCLIRYEVLEETEEDESEYGREGAVLRFLVGGVLLKEQVPPLAGYALAAFYWPTADAGDVPWGAATAQACLVGNPMLLPSLSSSCMTVQTWNATADTDETAAELVEDLPLMLQKLEQADPSIETRDYVSSGGITPAGQTVIELADARLPQIAPGAFSISQTSAGGSFSAPTPGPFSASTTAAGSEWSEGLETAGNDWGLPKIVMGVGFSITMLIVLGWFIHKMGGDLDVLWVFSGGALLFSGILAAIPFLVSVAICVVIGIIGGGLVIQRIWPS